MQPPCASIAAYAEEAKKILAPEIWQYLDAGTAANRTRFQNESAFDRITLTPRPLADVRGGHTRSALFGKTLAHPFLIAPIAYQRLFHTHGEVGVAMAALAQQTTYIISSLASQPISEIVATGADCWFQLYWQSTREASLRLLRKAEAAGAAEAAGVAFGAAVRFRAEAGGDSFGVTAGGTEGIAHCDMSPTSLKK
jgi:4-hydroxymandelate oxidase